MLIITADDYGKTRQATDSILKGFSNGRVTSTSAMVLMEDSERAASLALQADLEVGLHLNFTQPFSCSQLPLKLCEAQHKIISYLTKCKLSHVMYNPLLENAFRYVFLSQMEEFERLYRRPPDHYNGHHHMHLCANMLASRMIPDNVRMRRTFTFGRRERDLLNRLYRRFLDRCIEGRYISTDCFFSIAPVQNYERLQDIFRRAARENIEIEVHPERSEESEFLLSNRFLQLLGTVRCGGFRQLQ